MGWTVPYLPTPPKTVRRMLKIARVGLGDVVYDLGCGDGRILITAVKEFGADRAVGYEISKGLCGAALREVERQGLQAWEVFEAAKLQYPQETKRIEDVLVQLISEGKIRKKISGGELYSFFHKLGLRIELKTRIRFMEHGKLKSLEEKMKEKE